MPDTTGISAMGERMLGGMIARKLAQKAQKEMAMRVGLPILLEQKRSAQEHTYRMQEIAEKHQSELALKKFDLENEKPEVEKPIDYDFPGADGKMHRYLWTASQGFIDTGAIPEKPEKGKEPKEPAETNIADVGALQGMLVKPFELTKADQAILQSFGLVQKWQGFDKDTKERLAGKEGAKTDFAPLADLWKSAPTEGGYPLFGGGVKKEPDAASYLRQLAISQDEVDEVLSKEMIFNLAQQKANLIPGLVRGMSEPQALGVVDSLQISIGQDLQAIIDQAPQEPPQDPEQKKLDDLLNNLEAKYGGR